MLKITNIQSSALFTLANNENLVPADIVTPYYLKLPKFENDAVKYLKELLLRPNIFISVETDPENTRNRHGALIGHIWIYDCLGTIKINQCKQIGWLQQELITKGYALFYGYSNFYNYYPALQTVEKESKAQIYGMWQSDRMTVINANNVDNYNSNYSNNKFQLFEGIITNISKNGNVTFINFGNDWKNDFTVMINAANKKYLKEYFLFDFNQLKGRKVKIRGWVENYNGPMIKLSVPGQLQILN
ncbi:MAG: thermonuclease family protein [Pseudomonadota bacterium]